jgi:hypothetical protein
MDSLTQIVLGAAVGEAVLGRKLGNKAFVLMYFIISLAMTPYVSWRYIAPTATPCSPIFCSPYLCRG